jgi:hypothetical protein
MRATAVGPIAIAALGVTLLASPAAAQLRVGEVVATAIRSPHPYPDAAGERQVVWSHTLRHPGAAFLKIRFARFAVAGSVVDGVPAGDFVVVRTPDGREREVLAGTRREDFWSRSLPGDTAIIELHADAERNARGVEIDAYGWGEIPLSPRSICGVDESTGVCEATSAERIRLADAVARILVVSDCGGIFVCTGFLVSPDGLFVTNAHCANSDRESRSMEVWFNYTQPFEEPREPDCSLAERPNPDVFHAERLVLADCALDVAVHQLDREQNGNPASVYGFLRPSARVPQAGEPVWAPQHPSGLPKRIAETGIVSLAVAGGTDYCSDRPSCDGGGAPTGEATEFGHTIDTGPGSSGAPILDEQGRAIGLHHAGGCTAEGGDNRAVMSARVLPLLGVAPRTRVTTLPAPAVGPAPLAIEFDASASFDLDGGEIAEYQLDPGDGSPLVTSASPIVSHTYVLPGRFRAAVWVVDDEGTRSMRPRKRRVRVRE